MAQADTNDTTNPPAAEKPQEPSYLPTDISPEELFKAIGRLRREARDEIHRLIQFLDDSDNHMELDEAVDDAPCDDRELEPSLCGVTAGAANMPMDGYEEDLEGDDTTTLPSATSNGNATKYVIPAMAHLLNHTNPYGHAARVQTCHAHNRTHMVAAHCV